MEQVFHIYSMLCIILNEGIIIWYKIQVGNSSWYMMAITSSAVIEPSFLLSL